MKYLLDTNILIFLMKKGNKKLIEKISKQEYGSLALSSITLAELEYGAENSSNPELNRSVFLGVASAINVIDFDDNCAYEYGKIRHRLKIKGTPIGPMDMLIAATAKANNLIVVTNNTKEFDRVEGLKVQDWTK
jgi:tRNA(fMet)-specific endonuclease VapC